jgi:branched-chain amino acid transport system ATP-binding protein
MTAPVLVAEGLQKRFGAVVAADNVSVTVPKGARLSLIGSNGAGKTTFVNMVTGYMKPDRGTITLEGQDITRLGPREVTRRGVCRSFQIPQLCEQLTVLDNLLVAIGTSGQRFSYFLEAGHEGAGEAAHALLDRFGLDDYAERPVNVLPGGVRKLVDIAMALARHPKVLLLDEPTSGVSSDEKFPLMDRVMQALSKEDVAVLFVEHDMDIVTRYADRVLAFYAGRIIADDPPDEVLRDPEVQKYVTGTARA